MIKGFVTVGTTPFDALVEALDRPSNNVSLTFQIADGRYTPKHHQFVRFVPSVFALAGDANFVVTHAGAGTVYALLEENGVRLAVVPNTERSDKHQKELARYVAENRYACVLDVDDVRRVSLEELAAKVVDGHFSQYSKEDFFKVPEILDYLQCTRDS